nr:metallophosphoesterase [Cryobacterium roopkundense]
MANGGGRGIRIVDGTDVSISWAVYPAGSVAVDRSAHFGAPASSESPSQALAHRLGVPTPGHPSPVEAPTPTPTPTPTVTPAPTPTVTPAPTPTPDPTLVTAALQITEITPDTTNVGSGDGFEFIEVYNATAEPIDFSDYTLNYLYPLSDLTNSSTVRWPSTPADTVIDPGAALVFWIKNGPNDALTAADFNAQFGTSLTPGADLVEVFAGGLANGSPRGIEILTNTGFSVNTAYYNLDGVDDVEANVGIQYGADATNLGRQLKLGTVAATPGAVYAAQVPAGLMVVAADTTAPVTADQTLGEIDPAQNFALQATVNDDVQARTVTLHLKSNLDADFTPFNLTTDAAGAYRHDLQQVDLTAKRWFEYFFTASDGRNDSSTPVTRVALTGVDDSPVRLNVTDGQFLTGTTVISAAGDAGPAATPVSLSIDGAPVATQPELEAAPQFVFDVTAVNTFFKNGVLVGEDVLRIFDDGIPEGWETIATPVPLTNVTRGDNLVVSVWAGTKVAPEINLDENNDDFQIRNLRLVLPDGRSLQPTGYTDPELVLNMGDSPGKFDFYDASFSIPEDAYMAVAHEWDTTAVEDGTHPVTASNGTTTLTRQVTVDNTAPQVATSVVDGQLYQGEFMVDGEATDAGAGLDTLVATLDGRPITLPFATSSIELADGDHTLALTALDRVGNQSVLSTVFSTPVEEPGNELITPLDGATVPAGPVDLTARATDPTGDRLQVTLNEGFVASVADNTVRPYSGTTRIATDTDRAGKTLLTGDQVIAMARLDGAAEPVFSDDAFPYQLFEVDVPADAGVDFTARVRWDGTANADAKVLMYVQNVTTGAWDEVDRHVTIGEGTTAFTLDAMVPAANHLTGQVITVLIQHSEGFAGENLSDRASQLPANNVNDTPRSAYDFTLAWESDTQYYNASYYERQLDIHNYLLEEREATNLQYLFHTGDIVDNNLDENQWTNANAAYSMLDDAQLPYGVLAGNHDVGQKDDDYTAYKANFGAARYDANPWFGESFEDNRGHYDLITAGGMDFLMLYQGWAPSQEGIDWLNEVLARYPERTAILNLHEYMLTTGGLGEVPQQIYDEVVAPNANVAMVFSGHYHDAFTRIDQFDDTGDGIPDRSVYQMLFDYQGLPEGGQSFLRLLQFDNESQQIGVRTYSPYLDAYNSDDPTLDLAHQEFAVPYAAFGLTPMVKTLATDSFTVDILTTTEIAAFADVASGSEVTAVWTPGAGTHGWYAFSADPFGATAYSEVRRVTVAEPPVVEPAVVVPEAGPEASAPGAAGTPPAARSAVTAFVLSAESQALADTAAAALAAEVATDAATERTDAANADAGASDPHLAAVDEVRALGIWTIALALLGLLGVGVLAVIAARRIRSRP